MRIDDKEQDMMELFGAMMLLLLIAVAFPLLVLIDTAATFLRASAKMQGGAHNAGSR